MKILLAGAFGHVGSDILKALVDAGHNVVACDMGKRKLDFDGFLAREIDFTKESSFKGLCEGVDLVITTLSLLAASPDLSPEEINYEANKRLLDEAIKAGAKHFDYISEAFLESGLEISVLETKKRFEDYLKESGMSYTIIRPVGFFFEVAHRFQMNVEAGKVLLPKTKGPTKCNVVSTIDFANYVVEHLEDENVTLTVGGLEEYTYAEMARMFFRAKGYPIRFGFTPKFLFDLIVKMSPKFGQPFLLYDRWLITKSRVADEHYGTRSFEKYVYSLYGKDNEIC